jgi:hypothetical protein
MLLFGMTAQAFMPKLHSMPAVIGNSRLFGFGKYDSFESSRYEDALTRNKARTDVRNFLTQRAIQSFVYLLNQCRDPHTVNWMEVSPTEKMFLKEQMCLAALLTYFCFHLLLVLVSSTECP